MKYEDMGEFRNNPRSLFADLRPKARNATLEGLSFKFTASLGLHKQFHQDSLQATFLNLSRISGKQLKAIKVPPHLTFRSVSVTLEPSS